MKKINANSIRLSAEDKISLFSNMGTMLSAGIPIAETIESLLDESKKNIRQVLLNVQEDISSGHHLHQAIAKFPNAFDKVTVNLIKSAEESGTLETSLKDIEKNMQKEMQFSDNVKSALMYPALVMVVFVVVLIVMLLVVIPKISQVFSRLKVTLPFATKMMILLSDALIHHPFIVAGVSIAVVVGVFLFYRYKRDLLFNFLFDLPGISQLIRKTDLTHFTRNLYLLLSSGIPIVMALELAEEVVRKKEVKDLIKNARNRAVSGYPFFQGLRSKKRIVPEMMIKLMEVGEKTGTLETSMQAVADHMDYEVTKSLEKFTTVLEPVMLVVVALVVGGMMMAIISPMYGLISQVGAMR